MARSHTDAGASLELLLDTICNTFGGVLFLAMLVSLMLAQTRRQQESTQPRDASPALSAAEFTRLETRAEKVTAELERLEQVVATGRRAVTSLEVKGAAAMLDAMEAAERQARELEARRTRLLANLASLQASARRAEIEKARREEESERITEAAVAAREQLEASISEREQLLASRIRLQEEEARRGLIETKGQAPREHVTDKTEFGLMLKYGRLYAMKVRNGFEWVVNQEDFDVRPGLGVNRASPKPHKGLDLTVQGGREAGLTRILQGHPPDR